MRKILYAAAMALTAVACVSKTEQPYSTTALPPQTTETGTTPPNSALQGDAFTISTDAYYEATSQPASASDRTISLYMKPNHWARMRTEMAGSDIVKVDTGEWKTLNNGNLMLDLRRIGEKEQMSLEFKTDGEKLIYTGTAYGTDGLTLWVKPVPPNIAVN